MASPDILQAQLRELEQQRNDALQDSDAQLVRELDQEIATVNTALRQTERQNVAANAEFVGQDPQTGAFRYRNRVTGEVFLTVRSPSAAQQAAFRAANPPPPPEPPPAQSASQQVQTQTAQAPQPLPAANQPIATGDTGTDAPVKSLEQTQAISTNSNSGQSPAAPATNGAAANPPTATGAVIAPGQGANDDAGTGQTATAPVAVDAADSAEPNIRPRPNILDEFASYTYSASVYLITEDQYRRILTSPVKRVDGYNLLFQSGGAANNRGGPRNNGATDLDNQDAAADAGRSPFFDNDFYIDNVTLETLLMGKGSGLAHNATSLKFTVVEPNGITLLDRLYDAVANFEPRSGSGTVNYTAVTYLMVIRFYGYNSMGQPVQIRDRSYDTEGTSDPNAVVEKFIPFRINTINWSVGSRMVTYDWECTPVGQLIAGYTARGTVPFDIQLTETTVGGLLSGSAAFGTSSTPPANPGAATTATANDPRFGTRDDPRQGRGFTQTAAPAKVTAAPTDKKTVSQGIADAMNQLQRELVERGIYTYPDVYEIAFEGPGSDKIRDALLSQAGRNAIAQTASGRAATQDPAGLRPATNAVDKTTKNFSVTAGQQLLQVIDLVIRNSSYIYDQALVIVDQDGSIIPNPNSRNQPVKWYNISMQAERISKDLDPKRNDYAYRIRYVVSPFVVKNLDSVYFPVAKFSGVHKSYPYWFTGQNTAVLDYTETLNSMYHLTVSGSAPDNSLAAKVRERYTSSLADIIKYSYAPRSNQSDNGAQGKTFELAANAAESLYSPSDLAQATVRIVGDPAWIQQGTIVKAADSSTLNGQAVTTGFGADGSVSFDSQDILFEIVWKRPNDYDLSTGLADPYARSAARYNNYSAEQSRVYHCTRVVSEFKQGRFEQTLHGVLYKFPKPDLTNTADPAAANQATAADTDSAREPQQLVNPAEGTVDPAIQNILRSQQNSAANIGGQNNTKLTRPGPTVEAARNQGLASTISQATVPELSLYSQPQPPTTGTDTPVSSVVFRPADRLPAADPRTGRLTNTQIQELVNQQSSTVNTGPTTAPTRDSTSQPGVREF